MVEQIGPLADTLDVIPFENTLEEETEVVVDDILESVIVDDGAGDNFNVSTRSVKIIKLHGNISSRG